MYRSMYTQRLDLCSSEASTLTSEASTPTMESEENSNLLLEKIISSNFNIKSNNLSLKQIKEKLTQMVTKLKNMKECYNDKMIKYLQTIEDLYFNCLAEREEIGDFLADLGYAAISIQILTQMKNGIFENEKIRLLTYTTCVNYSDVSEKFAKHLAETGAVKLMTQNLGHQPYLDNKNVEEVNDVLDDSLTILHNIARYTGMKHYFKDIKTVEVIMPFINDEHLKYVALLTLADIVEEEDNDKLIDETNIIKNIVSWIHGALKDNLERRYDCYSLWELIHGLSKLAVNDSNKAKIIAEGALNYFVQILRFTDAKEQECVAECLWTLAFDKTVRQSIIDFPDLVLALEELKNSDNVLVKNNVQGVLWMIKGENDQSNNESRQSTGSSIKNHIFISYSWADKVIVKKIHNSLKSEGYKVWVDYDEMRGSTLEAMSEAVENAAVVLICMTEIYKNRPNCRIEPSKGTLITLNSDSENHSEAEYTLKLNKDYIPLIMQRNYQPKGWLGAMLGLKMYYEFTDKYPYEEKLQELLKELRSMGKSALLPGHKLSSVGITTASVNLVTSPVSSSHNQYSSTLVSMSNEHVENWLKSNGLHRLTIAFSQIDGKLIRQLKVMRERAPEFYHNNLVIQFGMSLIDILRFNDALDNLY